MKVCTVLFGVLVACAVSYAQNHYGPVMVALQPHQTAQHQVAVVEHPTRQKRSLLLGALGAGVIGAGVVGAGALGAGALVGAKAGFIGGALAAKHFSGRSYGGGYGGHGYGGYSHGYGGYSHGYGGYGHDYYDDYAVYEPTPVIYGGYRSYPSYYVEDEWC